MTHACLPALDCSRNILPGVQDFRASVEGAPHIPGMIFLAGCTPSTLSGAILINKGPQDSLPDHTNVLTHALSHICVNRRHRGGPHHLPPHTFV